RSVALTLRGSGRTLPSAAPSESKAQTTAAAGLAVGETPVEPEQDRTAAPGGLDTLCEEAPVVNEGPEVVEDRRRRPAPKAPKFLSDLDLTKASVQLSSFVDEKNPDGDMERYAVIAHWFKDNLGTVEITIDHIFTAYKVLGWQAQLPQDPGQTFRNLKSNKNWFDSGSSRGKYKINWNGETAVNKMGTPKS